MTSSALAYCKERIPKLRNKYSQKRNCAGTVLISTFMCLWAIYIFPPSICQFCCRKYVDRSWEYKNRSQTHECGNWDWSWAVPRKRYINGIFLAVRRDGGHEQLISSGGRFKPAFAQRDKKQPMIDLRGISTNWFKNHLCSSIRFSILRAPWTPPTSESAELTQWALYFYSLLKMINSWVRAYSTLPTGQELIGPKNTGPKGSIVLSNSREKERRMGCIVIGMGSTYTVTMASSLIFLLVFLFSA